MPLIGLNSTLIQTVRAVWQTLMPRRKAVDTPACHRSREENWMTLHLIKREHRVDAEGRWWLIEVRQCQYTGLRLRRTRRITD